MLPSGECHVWWARPDHANAWLASLLDSDERHRAEQFVHEADRLRYITAHGLARLLLGRYLGFHPAEVRFTAECRHCGGPHGKPRVAEPTSDIEFSWSHAGDRVVVALTRGTPVGVDVEDARSSWEVTPLQDIVLSAREREALDRLPVADRFMGLLRYWTRKEAVLKATGDGLAVPLARISVTGPDQPAQLLDSGTPPEIPHTMQLHDLDPGPGHIGCLGLLTDVRHRVVEEDGHDLMRGFQASPASWPR